MSGKGNYIMVLIELFYSFALIGFSSFGGLSMLPLISNEVIGHGWMNAEQVADIIAIAEMTPGPLGFNCATFAGMQAAGIPGAIAANLGVMTPTLTVCAVVAMFFAKFKDNKLMRKLLMGVRPACFGMVIGVAVSLFFSNYFTGSALNIKALAIGIIDAFLLIKRKVSIPKMLLFSAVMGLLLFGVF